MAYTTIKKPSDYFNTKLYTGNGGTQSITGVEFQPDLIWNKSRSEGEQHSWTDVLRGTNSQIHSEGSNGQSTATNSVTAFGSDGFTLGSDSLVNKNTINYASWNWKAGTAASGNTSGAGTPTAFTSSSNATSGFSIVKYQGNGVSGHTIPHGCGAVPSLIIIKQYDGTRNWIVYHKSLGNTKYLELNTNEPKYTAGNVWNSTTPTSSVFTLGDNSVVNASSNYIAYCFAEKQGYSKFGSYTGNGETDGAFVYTGFKPAFVIFKRHDDAVNWSMVDNKRDTYNPTNKRLFPDLSNSENTSLDPFIDMLSNGFKLKTSSTAFNGGNSPYIFIAFAEAPLVGDNPATAR